jgi:hypothetical protein
MVDVARRLCEENQIHVNEIWSYHTVGDQVRFTLVHRSRESSAPARSSRATSRPAGARRPSAPQAAKKPTRSKKAAKAPGRSQKRRS